MQFSVILEQLLQRHVEKILDGMPRNLLTILDTFVTYILITTIIFTLKNHEESGDGQDLNL